MRLPPAHLPLHPSHHHRDSSHPEDLALLDTLSAHAPDNVLALSSSPRFVLDVAYVLKSRGSRKRIRTPIIDLSAQRQFKHVLYNFVRDENAGVPPPSAMAEQQQKGRDTYVTPGGLRKVKPYWYNYTTMAKGRWVGREILEIVSTEFRDRSLEYYRYALESGVTSINGQVAKPDTIVRNGDRVENIVHRHEPPVTAAPVKIILHDKERNFIVVDKPGSLPVHAVARYYRQSLIEILKEDYGFKQVFPVNRLDRLTSGLMILPLDSKAANMLAKEFLKGDIRKEYIARCRGEFPEGEIVCEEPLLTVDRQMGLNIVHPEGKPSKTIFNRMHYDPETDSSVIHCQPVTGRSHQIRVHLQYLGYPIANDPVYSDPSIWGPNLGKGGVDLAPSDARTAPVAPPGFDENPETPASGDEGLSPLERYKREDARLLHEAEERKKLPRETGHDIGMGSPVPLSAEAVRVIQNLRNMKDKDEDWGRWRDVVFRSKALLTPQRFTKPPLPPQNRRKRGGPVTEPQPQSEAPAEDTPSDEAQKLAEEAKEQRDSEALPPATELLRADGAPAPSTAEPASAPPDATSSAPAAAEDAPVPDPPQFTPEEALAKIAEYPSAEEQADVDRIPAEDQMRYCPECYLPLHPDPKPEKLYIFLHALRYTTSLGCFETEMPVWAAKGWTWEREY